MAASNWDGAEFEAHRPLSFSIAYRMPRSSLILPIGVESRRSRKDSYDVA